MSSKQKSLIRVVDIVSHHRETVWHFLAREGGVSFQTESRSFYRRPLSPQSIRASYSTPFSANTQPSLLWHLICQLIHPPRNLFNNFFGQEPVGVSDFLFAKSKFIEPIIYLFNTLLAPQNKTVNKIGSNLKTFTWRPQVKEIYVTRCSSKSKCHRKWKLDCK